MTALRRSPSAPPMQARRTGSPSDTGPRDSEGPRGSGYVCIPSPRLHGQPFSRPGRRFASRQFHQTVGTDALELRDPAPSEGPPSSRSMCSGRRRGASAGCTASHRTLERAPTAIGAPRRRSRMDHLYSLQSSATAERKAACRRARDLLEPNDSTRAFPPPERVHGSLNFVKPDALLNEQVDR